MNCARCGAPLAPGAQACAVCGEPVAGYGYTAPMNYPQQGGYTGYPQGYPANYPGYGYPQQGAGPYQQSPYPQQQPYAGYPPYGAAQQGYGVAQQGYGAPPTYAAAPTAPAASPLSSLEGLPRFFLDALKSPAQSAQGVVARGDFYTGLFVLLLSALLAFICAMLLTRGVLSALFTGLLSLSGVNGGDQISQGIAYVARKLSPTLGGVAALMQVLSMLVPGGALTIYLCGVLKTPFSPSLFLSCMAVMTLPTLVVSLLCVPLSFLSPLACGVAALVGVVASYVYMGSLLDGLSGRASKNLVLVKLLCIGGSLLVTLTLGMLVGGTLGSGAISSLTALMTNMSSLL